MTNKEIVQFLTELRPSVRPMEKMLKNPPRDTVEWIDYWINVLMTIEEAKLEKTS